MIGASASEMVSFILHSETRKTNMFITGGLCHKYIFVSG
jgi:hypothetical protein